MTRCYYCGEMKDEILLSKRLSDLSNIDGKCVNKVPCENCDNIMTKGIMLIEVRDGESGDNPYRTGNVFVITQQCAESIFNNIDFNKHRVIFIEQSICKQLGLHNSKQLDDDTKTT